MELIGGTVSIESIHGQGTKVIFKLNKEHE
jgi:hypothetical protein